MAKPAEHEACAPLEVDQDAAESSAGCKILKKRNLQALRGVKPINDAGAGGFDAEAASSVCLPSANGSAWGVLLSKPRVTGNVAQGNHELTATWAVAHVDAAGRVVAAQRTATYSATPYGGTTFGGINNHSAVFDYDSDGEAELVLIAGTSEHTGTGDYRGSVWTFKGGKVQAYSPAPAGVVSAGDLDCDGRPDLSLTEPFDAAVNCSSMVHISVIGPTLTAHSLPDGTFSSSDSVAEGWARWQCEKSPPALTATDADTVDEMDLLQHVRCARLWGVPSTELVKQIQAACKAPRADERCGLKRPGVCVGMSTLLEWARATPPLTLR